MSHSEVFSIRQMVELTGLTEFTIRGWENRYAAFKPKRSTTGRREYSKADVQRALLLRELLKRGHKVGKVAGLSNPKLRSLFEDAASPTAAAANPAVEKALELMALQKWTELGAAFRDMNSDTPGELVSDFLFPALQALSLQVADGLVSVSQEHIFSAMLKEKIYSAISSLPKTPARSSKLRFILAAPEGDHHETSLLMAHLLIRSRGFESLYLGPHTPAQDLAETSLRFDATHLLLVTTVSRQGGAKQDPLTFISEVKKRLGARTRILVAGSQAPLAGKAHEDFSVLGSFSALEEILDKEAKHG